MELLVALQIDAVHILTGFHSGCTRALKLNDGIAAVFQNLIEHHAFNLAPFLGPHFVEGDRAS